MQTKSETKAFYDKIAKVYDLLAEHSERPMREAGLGLLAVAPGEHVLEIGFGTGRIVAELADAVGPIGRVFGIDISENMQAHAKDLLSGKGLLDHVSLDCGDAENLPYGDDSMDGIFMCFTLELFDTPDIPRVLAECRRVLRPGGRIVVVAVSKEGKEEGVKAGSCRVRDALLRIETAAKTTVRQLRGPSYGTLGNVVALGHFAVK